MLGRVKLACAVCLMAITQISSAVDVLHLSGGELSIYKIDRANVLYTKIDIIEQDDNSIYVQWRVHGYNSTVIEYGHGIANHSILTGSFHNGIHVHVDTAQLSDLVVYAGNGGVIDITAERIPRHGYEIHGTEIRSTEREERKFQGSKIVSFCHNEGTAFNNDISDANCTVRDNSGVVTVRAITPYY